MTFEKSDGVVSHFSRVPNSRAALAFANVVADSQIREQLFPFGSGKLSDASADYTYFKTLLSDSECKTAWNAYTDTATTSGFPYRLARGTVPLNGFRHYSIQDALYLVDYVRVRLEAIAAAGDTVPPTEIQKFAESVKSGLDYAASARSDCNTKLGVPLTSIDSEKKSDQLTASIKYYTSVVNGELGVGKARPWVDIYFALLPCIKGYYEIAAKLKQDPETVKNTLYYDMWIEPNADPFYVADYDTFLEAATKGASNDDWKRWHQIFKTTCDNEKNFFQLAIKDYGKYDVLEGGTTFTIRPYGHDNESLNVSGNTVTVTESSTKWTLVNSPEGYTIKNQNASLSVSATDTGFPYHTVQTSTDPEIWSINPIHTYDNAGKPTKGYQLFRHDNMGFVLDWNRDASKPKVFVANGYKGVSQSWIIDLAA